MKQLLLILGFLAQTWTCFSQSPSITQMIKVDQFGYRLNDEKVAVISDPQTGYNSAITYNPSMVLQVKNASTNVEVFRDTIVIWNSGTTQAQSGDKAWWFDFSALTAPGDYYILDTVNNTKSYTFKIHPCVYNDVLKQALRMYYFQRCGTAKLVANTGTGWSDVTCHAGNQQDLDCRLYNNTNVSTSKDLSGGWHDAGDYNKYVNFTFNTVLDLLHAYKENPTAFEDNSNIPESGNGVPDILDEIKYELNWLLKMQQSNGSLLSVIGGGGFSPPSGDTQARRYGPATTSATFTGAALFAFGAKQFNAAGQTAYATTLQTAAVNAWNWATANPGVTFYNTGILAAGENETDPDGLFARNMAAAIYLFDLTGGATYKTYVDNNYASAHLIQWSYVYPFETPMQDALLYYSSLPAATTTVKNAIIANYMNSVMSWNADNLPAYLNKTDAYRAYMATNNYTWNSNQAKSNQGNIFLNMNVHNINSPNATNYRNAALGFVNYMHGVNPNSKVYLSNMSAQGAENSVNQFYHGWFHDGSSLWDEVGVSTYGPAPGFIPGGPNPSYDVDACCPSTCGSAGNNALCTSMVLDPPRNQPVQKSYLDFNNDWPINSWEITEAGIYTNASYVRMLSKFCSPTSSCGIVGIKPFLQGSTSVYPNPFSNEINFKFSSATNETVKINIYDLSGKEVYTENKILATENMSIDIPEMRPGIYFIVIESSEKTERFKVIKMED